MQTFYQKRVDFALLSKKVQPMRRKYSIFLREATLKGKVPSPYRSFKQPKYSLTYLDLCRFPLNTWQTVYPNPNPKCSLLSRKEAPVHSGRLAPRSPRRRQHYLQRLSRVWRGDLQSPPTVKRKGKTTPLDDARTYVGCRSAVLCGHVAGLTFHQP